MSSSLTAALPQSVADQVVERAAGGDTEALGLIYDRHHREVRAFLVRLLGAPDLAEDVLHDTFLGLPKALRRFRGDASLKTYVMSIANNVAYKRGRSLGRRLAAVRRFGKEHRAPKIPDPEADQERRELADALSRALARLPMKQRSVVVLCVVEERSSREVGEIIGAPEATIRTRLHHAKKKLRQLLVQEGLR